jgi:hypothetical protein
MQDPKSSKTIVFHVDFDSDYSTICIESAECSGCSRDDDGCDTFFDTQLLALSQVIFYVHCLKQILKKVFPHLEAWVHVGRRIPHGLGYNHTARLSFSKE